MPTTKQSQTYGSSFWEEDETVQSLHTPKISAQESEARDNLMEQRKKNSPASKARGIFSNGNTAQAQIVDGDLKVGLHQANGIALKNNSKGETVNLDDIEVLYKVAPKDGFFSIYKKTSVEPIQLIKANYEKGWRGIKGDKVLNEKGEKVYIQNGEIISLGALNTNALPILIEYLYKNNKFAPNSEDYKLLKKLYTKQKKEGVRKNHAQKEIENIKTDRDWLENVIRFFLTGTTDERLENAGEGGFEFSISLTIQGKVLVLYVKGEIGGTTGIGAADDRTISASIGIFGSLGIGLDLGIVNLETGVYGEKSYSRDYNSVNEFKENLIFDIFNTMGVFSDDKERKEYYQKHKNVLSKGYSVTTSTRDGDYTKVNTKDDAAVFEYQLLDTASEYRKIAYNDDGVIDQKLSKQRTKDFLEREKKSRGFVFTIRGKYEGIGDLSVVIKNVEANSNLDNNGYSIGITLKEINLDTAALIYDTLSSDYQGLLLVFAAYPQLLHNMNNIEKVATEVVLNKDKSIINFLKKIKSKSESKFNASLGKGSLAINFSITKDNFYLDTIDLFSTAEASISAKDIPLYAPAPGTGIYGSFNIGGSYTRKQMSVWGDNSFGAICKSYNQIRSENELASITAEKEGAFAKEQMQRLNGQKPIGWSGDYKKDGGNLETKSQSWKVLKDKNKGSYNRVMNKFINTLAEQKGKAEWDVTDFPNGISKKFLENYFGKDPDTYLKNQNHPYKMEFDPKTHKVSNPEFLIDNFEEHVLYNLYKDREKYNWEVTNYKASK